MSRKEKQKTKYVDDGHTVYNMDVDGMPRRPSHSKESIGLNKKEKRAAIKAAYLTYLPIFIVVIVCFAITMLLIYLWLH